MLTQDWMMRQIETMTLAIAKLMFIRTRQNTRCAAARRP